MEKIRKSWKKILCSVIIGCIVGIIIGVAGSNMNVPPIFVSVFSGSTTGCIIVILLENHNNMKKATKRTRKKRGKR